MNRVVQVSIGADGVCEADAAAIQGAGLSRSDGYHIQLLEVDDEDGTVIEEHDLHGNCLCCLGEISEAWLTGKSAEEIGDILGGHSHGGKGEG
jgi:hypothetical protein